ncbi:MAG: class I SAM-dependent methyltransferase, partial [Actinomycetota bacterium]|nr:class I SAM-dependent methyltransferase [Actinomycetota bacterium]
MNCKICGCSASPFIRDIFDNRHGYPGRFDIYQCSSCGFCQTYPEPTGAELDRLYTDYYPRKGLDTSQVKASAISISGFKDRLAIWLNGTNNSCHLYAKPGMRVLDYGCGTGVSLLEIQNLGAEAFGIEVDENVKTIAEDLSLMIHFGRLDDLPY